MSALSLDSSRRRTLSPELRNWSCLGGEDQCVLLTGSCGAKYSSAAEQVHSKCGAFESWTACHIDEDCIWDVAKNLKIDHSFLDFQLHATGELGGLFGLGTPALKGLISVLKPLVANIIKPILGLAVQRVVFHVLATVRDVVTKVSSSSALAPIQPLKKAVANAYGAIIAGATTQTQNLIDYIYNKGMTKVNDQLSSQWNSLAATLPHGVDVDVASLLSNNAKLYFQVMVAIDGFDSTMWKAAVQLMNMFHSLPPALARVLPLGMTNADLRTLPINTDSLEFNALEFTGVFRHLEPEKNYRMVVSINRMLDSDSWKPLDWCTEAHKGICVFQSETQTGKKELTFKLTVNLPLLLQGAYYLSVTRDLMIFMELEEVKGGVLQGLLGRSTDVTLFRQKTIYDIVVTTAKQAESPEDPKPLLLLNYPHGTVAVAATKIAKITHAIPLQAAEDRNEGEHGFLRQLSLGHIQIRNARVSDLSADVSLFLYFDEEKDVFRLKLELAKVSLAVDAIVHIPGLTIPVNLALTKTSLEIYLDPEKDETGQYSLKHTIIDQPFVTTQQASSKWTKTINIYGQILSGVQKIIERAVESFVPNAVMEDLLTDKATGAVRADMEAIPKLLVELTKVVKENTDYKTEKQFSFKAQAQIRRFALSSDTSFTVPHMMNLLGAFLAGIGVDASVTDVPVHA